MNTLTILGAVLIGLCLGLTGAGGTALSLPVLPVLAARRGRFSPTTNEETHA